jgi:hypothetical protein
MTYRTIDAGDWSARQPKTVQEAGEARGADLIRKKETRMAKKRKVFDLYTFVAGAALEERKPFPVECNCGAVITIMPPFQDEHVVCPRCEFVIRMLVVEGDPGYIIGAGPDGKPTLLPVQGSSQPHPNQLSQQQRNAILAKVSKHIPNNGA